MLKGRNLIVLADGTGNSAAKAFKTNVWRLYQALDLAGGSQLAVFGDGVGTSSIKPLQILGLALGVGVKRNVLNCCSFCAALTTMAIAYRPSASAVALSLSGCLPGRQSRKTGSTSGRKRLPARRHRSLSRLPGEGVPDATAVGLDSAGVARPGHLLLGVISARTYGEIKKKRLSAVLTSSICTSSVFGHRRSLRPSDNGAPRRPSTMGMADVVPRHLAVSNVDNAGRHSA